jgi:hypothetical protein
MLIGSVGAPLADKGLLLASTRIVGCRAVPLSDACFVAVSITPVGILGILPPDDCLF